MNLKLQKNRPILWQPNKGTLYFSKRKHKRSQFLYRAIVLLSAFCFVTIVLVIAIYWLRTINGAEPAYKPVDTVDPVVETSEESPPATSYSYEKSAAAIPITEVVFYDQNKLLIERDALDDNSVQERYYDSELQYEFSLTFRDEQHAELLIDDAFIKSITLDQKDITINTQRISAFNVIHYDNYISIEYISPKEKYDKIVLLDPGHGGHDAGAVVGDVLEKDLNFTLALRVFKMFQTDKENDIKVYMTRQSDVYWTPEERINMGKDVCDFFISIHHNVDEYSPKTNGAEAYFYNREQAISPSGLTSEDVATITLDNVITQTGSRDRGVILNKQLIVLFNAMIPATLIEIGFMTNVDEMARLQDDEFVEKTATGLYNSIKKISSQWDFRQ